MTDGPTRICLLMHGETLPALAASGARRMLTKMDLELSLVVEDTSFRERADLEVLLRVVDLECVERRAALTVYADDLHALLERLLGEFPGSKDAD